MKLLNRILLCYCVLFTKQARDWRRLAGICGQEAWRCSSAELLAALQAENALETERQQVAAGVRTTRQAEQLLAEARHLVEKKR